MEIDIRHKLAKWVEAYCDGQLLKSCYWANEETGEARCWERDGEYLVTQDGKMMPIVHHGKIEIRLKDTAPDFIKEEYSLVRKNEMAVNIEQ